MKFKMIARMLWLGDCAVRVVIVYTQTNHNFSASQFRDSVLRDTEQVNLNTEYFVLLS